MPSIRATIRSVGHCRARPGRADLTTCPARSYTRDKGGRVRNSALARDTGLRRDMAALRRYFWLPLAAVAVAVVAALGLGSLVSDSGEARFRVNVVVDALPPLFGPAVLPGPFDYAAVATSDAVVADVATRTGTTAEALRPRLN